MLRRSPDLSSGFSLLETLIVLAIIMVLMAIAMPHYLKAIRQAKEVAGNEAKRQSFLLQEIARIQCGEIPPNFSAEAAERLCARRSYRRAIDAGKFDLIVTQLLYQVGTDAEFNAYWNTLINVDESVPVSFTASGELIATDEDGAQHVLPKAKESIDEKGGSKHIIAWDFISTKMAHMNSDFAGTVVLLSDGSRTRVDYPDPLPGTTVSTRTVAILSNRYMEQIQ